MQKFFVIMCLLVVFIDLRAQNTIEVKPRKLFRGTFYLSWGYNREGYTKSDIHLKNTKTDNYDFTLIDAKAHDRPEFNKGLKNFLATDLTIPQYNFHVGYFFNDKHNLGVEVSWDHLKYIVYDNVNMHVHGNVRGEQIDDVIFVSSDFVHVQHTNGNNYLMLNIVKLKQLYKNKFLELNAIAKAGAGPLMSVSITTIFNEHRDTRFLMQGFVLGGTLGGRLNITRYLFLQPSFQLAWADYLSTPIGNDGVGRITQNFGSYTFTLEGGFAIPLSKNPAK